MDQTATVSAESAAPQPAAPEHLHPAEVRKGLRFSTWEGAVATVHMSITGSAGGSVFLTGFALLLGANNFQLGLLGALPFVGQLTQFIGAYLEERIGKRRPLVQYGSLISRLVWGLLLALPFLTILNGAQLALFFIGLIFSYALNGVAGNAWLSWMSDLVPPRQRGSYFGLRNTVVSVSAMASTFVAGQILDQLTGQGQEPLGYAIIFGIAVISAFGAAYLVGQQPEPPLKPKGKVVISEIFSGPFRDGPFRRYTLTAGGWALVTGIASPFFNAFGINNLQLSFSALAIQGIVTSMVGLIFTPLLGRFMDQYGYRQVTTSCIFGTILLPWGWALSTPDNIVPLFLTSIFSGVFWPGVNQGLTNILMDRAPADRRGAAMAAMAAHSAIVGLGTLLSGLLGGVIASLLVNAQIDIGFMILGNLTILFALSSLGRFAMAMIFLRTL